MVVHPVNAIVDAESLWARVLDGRPQLRFDAANHRRVPGRLPLEVEDPSAFERPDALDRVDHPGH